MDDNLKRIISNSKRHLNLKKLSKGYNLKLAHVNLAQYFLTNRNITNRRYIVIPGPINKNYMFSKKLFKFGLISSIIGICFYFRDYFKNTFLDFQKEKINGNVKKYIHSLLISSEIKEGGVELLQEIFKNDYSKQSTIELLENLLKDPYVMENTKIYGVGLFNELLKEEELRGEFKKLLIDLLRMEEIKTEGSELLRHIIEKEESKDIMSQYFKVIFLRSDIIKALSSVITDSAIYTMNGATTKKKFAEFILDVWSDSNLRWYVIKKSLNFWQPASATVKNADLKNPEKKIIREEIKSLESLDILSTTDNSKIE
jgi:hypothetical protein